LIRFNWFIELVWFNQINETDQTAVTCCNAINELKLSLERPTPAILRSATRLRWDKLWTFVPAQQIVGQFIASFKEFPPSQKSGSFSMDQVLQSLQSAPKSGN
jgi:arylsulfatase